MLWNVHVVKEVNNSGICDTVLCHCFLSKEDSRLFVFITYLLVASYL